MLLPLRIQNLDTPAVATGGGSGAGAVDEPRFLMEPEEKRSDDTALMLTLIELELTNGW